MIAIRILLIVVSLAGIIGMLCWSRQNRDRWLYVVAPLSWLANVTLFATIRLSNIDIDVYALNTWSAIIHLHGVLTLSGAMVILCTVRHE